jgi:hypothetical protein
MLGNGCRPDDGWGRGFVASRSSLLLVGPSADSRRIAGFWVGWKRGSCVVLEVKMTREEVPAWLR